MTLGHKLAIVFFAFLSILAIVIYTAFRERRLAECSTPPSGRDMPNQWHGSFITAGKSSRAEFVALMRIGAECKPDAGRSAVVFSTAEGLRVEIDGMAVSFGAEGASVEPKEGSPLLAKNVK